MCRPLGESSKEPVAAAAETWCGHPAGLLASSNGILGQSDATASLVVLQGASEPVRAMVSCLCWKEMRLSILTRPESNPELPSQNPDAILDVEAERDSAEVRK